jgi:class 3 adenylate cyclase
LTPAVIALGIALLLVTASACGFALHRHREVHRLRDRLEQSALDLQSLQAAFSQFAPDEVIERIIAGSSSDIGEKKTVTVLFADLVGFTALSEVVDPPVLLRILNGYFERMSGVISDNNGYVSTLIGDGLLALFGSMHPNPWQINDAVHAAQAMRGALTEYNAELVADGLPALSIGIGVHSGSGVVGLVGSRQRREFAFVGRTVNIAARVQDLTRRLGADLIVTGAVQSALDPAIPLSPLPATQVKGVAKPLELYAVLEKPSSTEPTPETEEAANPG